VVAPGLIGIGLGRMAHAAVVIAELGWPWVSGGKGLTLAPSGTAAWRYPPDEARILRN
jgi:hypothetical protein